jgi:transcriptional/translational regulatory protein YebC/TACO1
MVNICILCEESKVQQVKDKLGKDNILKIEVSENGQKPATHYFCSMMVSEEKAQRLFDKEELTIMELSKAKDFLEKWNLKIIR